jgi:hypothetical protein
VCNTTERAKGTGKPPCNRLAYISALDWKHKQNPMQGVPESCRKTKGDGAMVLLKDAPGKRNWEHRLVYLVSTGTA